MSSTRQLEIDSLPRPPLYPSYNTGTSIQADSDRSALHQVEFMTSESESETVRAQVERGSRLSGKEKAPDKRNTEHNKNCSRKHELNNKKPIEKTKQISSSSGTKPAVQLLPPNAFLVRHDGSPLVNPVVELGGVNMANVTIDTARTDASTRSLATSNLSSTIRRLDRQGVGHVTVDTVPGITTTSMISPADEVLYIKQQLIIFKDTKAKLKKAKEQLGQLTSYLDNKVDGSHDESIQDEVTLLKAEVQYLTDKVRADKPRVVKLTERVQQLADHG